jgi:hypothetical protein
MVNTDEEKIMTTLMTQLLERLAAMFPRQDYQSRLEHFISAHRPKTSADVEHLERQFYVRQAEGWL